MLLLLIAVTTALYVDLSCIYKSEPDRESDQLFVRNYVLNRQKWRKIFLLLPCIANLPHANSAQYFIGTFSFYGTLLAHGSYTRICAALGSRVPQLLLLLLLPLVVRVCVVYTTRFEYNSISVVIG